MREYKFRGKRLDNGEWVHGYYCACGICADKRDMQYAWPLVTEAMSVGVISAKDFGGVKVDAATVGRYTGLKDGDADVYQHDIWDDIYIDWCDKCASMEPHNLATRRCECCDGELDWSDVVHGFRKGYAKIEGNIHEAAK